MKRAWQIALLGFAVVFPLSAVAAEPARTSLLDQPQFEASLRIPGQEELRGPRRWSGSWALGTEVQNFSEGKDEGTGVAVIIGSDFNYKVAPWARFHLDVQARFTSSRTQVRYDEEGQFNGLRMSEGYLAFGDPELFEFRVGAISQRELDAALLLYGRRAFPGLREDLVLAKGDQGSVRFWAQQTIPTSFSLNAQRAEREPTPTFLTETLNFKITPVKEFEAQFNATHFRFSDLPAVVAFDSSALGNSVNGDVAANSGFKYGFNGFALGTDFCFCLVGPLSFRVGGQWLQNTSAPQKANRGQVLYLETEVRAGKTMNIRPRVTSFFNESDTSPAVYNRWRWGNNNRKGVAAEIEVEFVKHGFTLMAEYVQASLINDDPFQFDKQVFVLGVETNHVPF